MCIEFMNHFHFSHFPSVYIILVSNQDIDNHVTSRVIFHWEMYTYWEMGLRMVNSRSMTINAYTQSVFRFTDVPCIATTSTTAYQVNHVWRCTVKTIEEIERDITTWNGNIGGNEWAGHAPRAVTRPSRVIVRNNSPIARRKTTPDQNTPKISRLSKWQNRWLGKNPREMRISIKYVL